MDTKLISRLIRLTSAAGCLSLAVTAIAKDASESTSVVFVDQQVVQALAEDDLQASMVVVSDSESEAPKVQQSQVKQASAEVPRSSLRPTPKQTQTAAHVVPDTADATRSNPRERSSRGPRPQLRPIQTRHNQQSTRSGVAFHRPPKNQKPSEQHIARQPQKHEGRQKPAAQTPQASPSTLKSNEQTASRKVRQATAVSKAKPAQQLNEITDLLLSAHNQSQVANTVQQYSNLIRLTKEAISLGPTNEQKEFADELISWALNRRGQLYTEAGKLELADGDYHAAVEHNPENWRALHNRGVSFAEAGQFAEAFDDFSRVIQINPQHAKALTNRATLFIQAGDLESARDDYRKSLELDPHLASTHVGLARVCHLLGHWREALEHFTAATEAAPDNASICCSRADLLADMGRYAEALTAYAETIEIDPEFAHAYRNGAWLLATCPEQQFRDVDNALVGARQALEFEYGQKHVALDTLAAALANAGQFDEAVATLQSAIDIAPEDTRQQYLSRARLYRMGQPFRSQPPAEVSQASYEAAQ